MWFILNWEILASRNWTALKSTVFRIAQRALTVWFEFRTHIKDSLLTHLFYIVKHENLFDYKSSCFENEKHQTRVSLLLELVSDAYLTEISITDKL